MINSKEDRNWGKMEQRTYGIENIKIVEVKQMTFVITVNVMEWILKLKDRDCPIA